MAEGADTEIQELASKLPWKYILENELSFIPLSLALIAERRKGESNTIFWPFLQSLPDSCSNAIGADGDEGLEDLLNWAPHLAAKIQRKRLGIKHLHQTLAPPSLSWDELKWAAMNVCSRSLVRKRIMELSADQIQKVGEFAASDHSRMLPIIDMVNHGSDSNAWVGHLSHGDEDTNDFSTSLKSIRDIEEGEELLFDYGPGEGKRISNDRLLIDYGFVLPGHTERVSITLEEINAAIHVLNEYRVGMRDVREEDLKGLESLIDFLHNQASKTQDGAPLAFDAGSGEPTLPTLSLALAMTCRDQDDVSRVLKPVQQISSTQQYDASLLPRQIVESCSALQVEFGRFALKTAASTTIKRPAVLEGDCAESNVRNMGGFASIARKYSKMCEDILHDVATNR